MGTLRRGSSQITLGSTCYTSYFAVDGLVITERIDESYQLLRRVFVAMVIERDVGDIRRHFSAHRVNRKATV